MLASKRLAHVERRGALVVVDLETGAVERELQRTHVIASHRDGELWLQTSRGYERVRPQSLKPHKPVVLPTARWEGAALLWGVHDVFRGRMVYRSAEHRKHRFSSTHPDYLAAVNVDSSETAYVVELPMAGNVEGLWATSGHVLCSTRSQDDRLLVVLDRRSGKLLQVAGPVRSRVRLRSWGGRTLVDLGGRWHRWDEGRARLRPCVGVPNGASLQVLGRTLLSHHRHGLRRLGFDGTRFVTEARQPRLKHTSAAFRVGRRLGCFVSTDGECGPYTLAWIGSKGLEELGRSDVELSGELRVTVAGRCVMVETDDGLVALRVGLR